ncbi:unnamed protein product [Parnassius apollo]|uniref:(apollo) hypothetical protein n=1 Tax=Parnassius apollo TaxID=110799 RepID=A0A8S3WV64_PARAO|nr:unnamed protein product [Parnassius apollo]
MSQSDESPPLSRYIQPERKMKRKISVGRSTRTENHYICYVKLEEDDYTAYISLPASRFFNQRPEDPRNEHFGTLIESEMESVPHEIRSQVYMDIINLICHAW